MIFAWLRSLGFTLAVEVPVFVLFARGQVPAGRAALAGAAGTLLTHPVLWFLWPRFFHDYTSFIVTGEILVAVIEGFTFFALARSLRLSRAISASFIANAASYGLGALLRSIGLLF